MQQATPPQKFTRPRLSAHARAGDAFIANVTAAVAQIRANRAGAAAGGDPEFLHQLRVGMRRLRSTLQACRKLLRRKESLRLDRRLSEALRALGEARDWDVFEHALGGSALRHLARARAELARKRARALARSAPFRFLPEEVMAWARGRPWRGRSRAGEAMDEFARRALESACARLFDAADGIDWKDTRRRHRVRIRVKRLRYACDCFAAAWPEAAMEAFQAKLRRMQETLGELNDIDVQRRLLQQLLEAGAPARPALQASQLLSRRERRLLAVLRRSWKGFAEVSPYWRVAEAVPVAG